MLKASLSFVLLLAGVVSAISADYADAKQVAANFSQPRQTVSQRDNHDSGQVSELVFRGTGFKPSQYGCGPDESCAPKGLPPAFAPPQIGPVQTAPAVSPVASVVSDVTQNGVLGLLGLVVGAIAASIGGIKGHFKANDEDKVYADYWQSVRDNASSQTKVKK